MEKTVRTNTETFSVATYAKEIAMRESEGWAVRRISILPIAGMHRIIVVFERDDALDN
jgi:hypothetical protein